MNIQDILNKVGNTVNKGITASTKNIPLEYAYIAYKISKGYAIENVSVNNQVLRDLYLYTYIEVNPVIVALMEDGTYKDLVNNIKYNKIEYNELISRHLARGENVSIDNYPKVSRDNCIGIFNPINFKDIADVVVNADLNSKEISLKFATQMKKSYTILEMDNIYKKYKSIMGENETTILKYITVPPVRIDELDNIKTPYNLESEFLYMYYTQPQDVVFNDIKQKAAQYSVMKNTQ